MNPNYLPALIEASQSEYHAVRARAAQKILEHELAEVWPAVVEKAKAKLSGEDLDLHLRVMPSVLWCVKLEDWVMHSDAYRREHGFEQLPGNLVTTDSSDKVIRHAVETLKSEAIAFVRRAAAELLRKEMELRASFRGFEEADEEEAFINEHVPLLLHILDVEADAAVRVELVGLLGWITVMRREVDGVLEARRREDVAVEVKKAAKRALRMRRAHGKPRRPEKVRVGIRELRAAWRHAAGFYLRAYSRPRSLENGTLTIDVSRQSVQKEIEQIRRKKILPLLNEALGARMVKKIEIVLSPGAEVARPKAKPAAERSFRRYPKAPAPPPPATATTTHVFIPEPEKNFDWLEECG